jgi:hypothetical protein
MREWGESRNDAGRTWFWALLVMLAVSAAGSSYVGGAGKPAGASDTSHANPGALPEPRPAEPDSIPE